MRACVQVCLVVYMCISARKHSKSQTRNWHVWLFCNIFISKWQRTGVFLWEF